MDDQSFSRELYEDQIFIKIYIRLKKCITFSADIDKEIKLNDIKEKCLKRSTKKSTDKHVTTPVLMKKYLKKNKYSIDQTYI